MAIEIKAPVDGWAIALSDVPDPAFAEKMVGDGIAIDPITNIVKAPCDGVLVSIHRAHHACVIRTHEGAEILIHIGIDTVELGGAGFTVIAKEGAQVKTGDPLIRFDPEILFEAGKNMVVVVLVTNMDDFRVGNAVSEVQVDTGSLIFTLESTGTALPARVNAGVDEESAENHVPFLIANGFHARPAANLANAAKTFPGKVLVACNGQEANGKSMTALMSLGARHGDNLTLTLHGNGAEKKLKELIALIQAGLGDPIAPVARSVPSVSSAVLETTSTNDEKTLPFFKEGEEVLLSGVIASGGSAVGSAFRFEVPTFEFPERGEDIEQEKQKIEKALATAKQDIAEEARTGNKTQTAIFAAHEALLDDPSLTDVVFESIQAGKNAGTAWQQAISAQVSVFAKSGDLLIRERVADLRDIEKRICFLLLGKKMISLGEQISQGDILVAEDLLPSDFSQVVHKVSGILTGKGGPTAHVAILAASAGIPMIVAAGSDVLRIPNKAPLILNANRGEARVFVNDSLMQEARKAIAVTRATHARNIAEASKECVLKDGTRIEVFANLGRPGDGRIAIQNGAEGCGLLRSEFLFLDRSIAPTEDEQLEHYQDAANALSGKPLIIRTLDVGGDKPLAYLPLPREENPVLGIRGVRISLRYPDLMRQQIRAILRVQPHSQCRLLVPMVNGPEDIQSIRKIVEEESGILGLSERTEIGAMIEVPIAAVMADHIAQEADFLSIGTNDLTQYALAMDRGNPLLAPRIDALEPGVLRLISKTVEGAKIHKKPVAVCGGAASDPAAALILIGLGVQELSVAPAVIPEIKAALRKVDLSWCQTIAQDVLKLKNAKDVRAYLQEHLTEQ